MSCLFFAIVSFWWKKTANPNFFIKKYSVENTNYFRLNPSWMAVLVTSPHCNVDHPKFRTLQWMASHCQIIHTPNQKKPPNQSLQKTTLAMKTLWQTMMPIYVLLGMWLISCYLSKRGLISEKKLEFREIKVVWKARRGEFFSQKCWF